MASWPLVPVLQPIIKKKKRPRKSRLVLDLHAWLVKGPHKSIASTKSGDALFDDFYRDHPEHAPTNKRKKGSGIKTAVETHGQGLLTWVDGKIVLAK